MAGILGRNLWKFEHFVISEIYNFSGILVLRDFDLTAIFSPSGVRLHFLSFLYWVLSSIYIFMDLCIYLLYWNIKKYRYEFSLGF